MSANGTTDDSPKKRKIGIDGDHQEGQADVKILKLEAEKCNGSEVSPSSCTSQSRSSTASSSQASGSGSQTSNGEKCNGSEVSQSSFTSLSGSSTASTSQASSSGSQISNGEKCNGSEVSQSSFTSQSGSSTASTSQASSSGSQISNGGSLERSGGVSRSHQPRPPLLPPVQNVAVNPPQEIRDVLQLQEGSVFANMMTGFSNIPLPTHITYDGEAYNLTSAFDEFWSEFYTTPGYTKGHITKIPDYENLTDLQLLVIAKILRRGWEDQRYFPKKIAQPFLEACILNRQENKFVMMSKKIVLDFLEPTHELVEIIQDDTKPIVDQDIIEACKRWNPDSGDSYLYIGAEKDAACLYVVRDYMLNTRASRIWTNELIGLLDLEMFRFLMSPEITLKNDKGEDMKDSENNKTYIPPHKLWRTFFHGLNQDIIDHYDLMLGDVNSECYYCKNDVLAKRFLSCPKVLSSFCADRHDCILRKIDRKLSLAMEREKGIFASGKDWKRIIMYGNKWNGWPSDLKTSDGKDLPDKKHPHIVAYSLSPTKTLHIIEPSISWEHWITLQEGNKKNEYDELISTLERNGYKVTMHVLVMGSRGVVTQDIYNFFHDVLGMTHSDVSRTLEKISKTIATMPYNDFIYNKAENGMYQI